MLVSKCYHVPAGTNCGNCPLPFCSMWQWNSSVLATLDGPAGVFELHQLTPADYRVLRLVDGSFVGAASTLDSALETLGAMVGGVQ